MLYIKAFHIIAVVAWFAGLFYLPRLFVYHSQAKDQMSLKRFCIMERRLYYGIMWPSAILTTLLGGWLLIHGWEYYSRAGWMHAKLLMVLFVWIYHLSCGHYVHSFASNDISSNRSGRYFRIFNEIPTLLLTVIVLLVVVKPF